MDFKFVVAHSGLNRFLKCRKDQLLVLARDKFNVTSQDAVLLYHNVEFNLDIAVSSPDELPDGGAVKLVVMTKPQERSLSRITDISRESVTSGEVRRAMEELQETESIGGGIVIADGNVREADVVGEAVGNVRDVVVGPDSIVNETTAADKSESTADLDADAAKKYVPFRVPDDALGSHLQNAVRSGEDLDKADRLRLMDVIHEQFVAQRGSKYMGAEIDNIIACLVEQFPGLYKTQPLVVRMRLVKTQVKDKFRNKRRLDKDREVVSKKKTKAGLANYLPRQSHVPQFEAIELMKKDNLTVEELDDAMRKTLPERRRLLIKHGASIRDLLVRFPRLASVDQMWSELARIRGAASTGPEEATSASLKMDQLVTNISTKTGCTSDEEAIDHLLHACEVPYAIFNPTREAKWPHFEDDSLVIEGHKVLRVPGGRQAKLLIWGLAFTVFAQPYAKRTMRLLAHVMCATVLRSDQLHPLPCGWRSVGALIM